MHSIPASLCIRARAAAEARGGEAEAAVGKRLRRAVVAAVVARVGFESAAAAQSQERAQTVVLSRGLVSRAARVLPVFLADLVRQLDQLQPLPVGRREVGGRRHAAERRN